MKHFRITSQPIIVAPKSNRDNGESETVIIAAESLEDILRKEEWLYCDPADKYSMSAKEFAEVIADIKKTGIFYTNDSGEHWEDPRSEDGYALDAIKVTVKELSDKEVEEHFAYIKKLEENKIKAKEEKKKKNDQAWLELLTRNIMKTESLYRESISLK